MAVLERRSIVEVVSAPRSVSTREAVDPLVSAKFTFLMTLFLVLVVMRHATNVRSINETSLAPISSSWLVFSEHLLSSRSVPFFFVVSGYLLYRTGEPSWNAYRSKFEKRLVTIGLPYLIWATLSFLVCTFVGLAFHSDLVRQTAEHSQVWIAYFQNLLSPVGFHLWYLRNLLLLVLASPLIYFCLQGSRWVVTFGALICLMFLGSEMLADNARDLLCFSTGMLLSGHEKLLTTPIPRGLWICGITVGVICLALNAYLVVATGKQNVIIGLFSTATYPLLVWHLFRLNWPVLQNPLYQSLARNSFFVYLAHVPLLFYVTRAWEMAVRHLGISPLHPVSLGLSYLVSIGLTILICLGLASIMRLKLPKCYAALTGGR